MFSVPEVDLLSLDDASEHTTGCRRQVGVDFVQADRFRRKVAQQMMEIFSKVDMLLVPSLRDEMLPLTNSPATRRSPCAQASSRSAKPAATGHPIPNIRCQNSARRAASLTASR
jgi:hypothetical protein